jgi:hydrogenase/urease accessory protein HupE
VFRSATRLLAIHKSAVELGLMARPRAGTIARIYGFGYIVTGLVALLPLW